MAVEVAGPDDAGCPNQDTYQLARLPAQPDITAASYNVVTTPGSAPTTVQVTGGYSLGRVIDTICPNLSQGFGFAELTGGIGHDVLVPYQQIAASGNGQQPVLWDDGSSHIDFADGNPADYISIADPYYSGITIYLHSGSVLSVNASATATKVKAGQTITFALGSPVTGQAAGESLTYEWVFGDGSTAAATTAAHRYLLPGTYYAYLQVTGSDDSLGFSQTIPVVVGSAPKGPNRAGGGHVKSKSAPNHGAGVKGSGTARAHRGRPPTAPAQATSGAVGATFGAVGATSVVPASPARPLARNRPTARRELPLATGATVTGTPLAAVASESKRAVPAKTGPGVSNAARTGHLRLSSSFTIGEWFWVTLTALASLLAGAGLESRAGARVSRRRLHAGAG